MGNTTHFFASNGTAFDPAKGIWNWNGSVWAPAKAAWVWNGSAWEARYSVLSASGTSPISGMGSGASTSGTPTATGVSVSASGSIGSSGFSWAPKSGDGSIAIASGGSTSNPTFNRLITGVANGSSSSTYSAVWTCTVTDGDTGATTTFDATVNLAWTNTIPAFTPHVDDYSGVGSSSNTVPAGAAQLVLEVWGGGGGGGAGATGGNDHQGGGGGAGGYAKSIYALVSGDWGKTINYDAGGAPSSTSGTALNAGSVALTANGGNAGFTANGTTNGAGNSGGTASGGNTTNATGASGIPGNTGGTTGQGGGANNGWGAGGQGGYTVSNTGRNLGIQGGRVKFTWT